MNVTFRQEIERQALAARRQRVRDGELLREDDFRERLHVSESQLARMVAKGDIFTIEVDGVEYFPSLLVTPEVDLKRLHAVCRILVPAPPSCRLGYLSSQRANLGGISPIDALHDDESYRALRRMARAYAAEWWRTVVTVYTGRYAVEPGDIEPALTAADEVDPRVNLWKRASDALQSGGYIWPSGPYAVVNEATVFVTQHPSGQAAPLLEARSEVCVVDGVARAHVECRGKPIYAIHAISVREEESIVDVVINVVLAVKRSQSQRTENALQPFDSAVPSVRIGGEMESDGTRSQERANRDGTL
jgi:hypothetical protein